MLVYVALVICALVFAAVKAEQVISDAQVIICAILRHEDLYVDEWLRYHQYLGFDFAYLHDNDDTPSTHLSRLHLTFGEFVKVHVHPGLNKQRSAYRKCVETYRNNTWAAFIDVDEFIVLRNHSTIKEFLRDLAPKGGSVVLNWSRFSNNGTMKYSPEPVLSRFTYTTKELNHHIKSIAYLNHTKRADIHAAELFPGHPTVDVQGRAVSHKTPWMENHTGNKKIAYINHYHTKSFEEFVVKKRRGRADLKFGGPNVSYADILKDFDEFNQPHAEIQDTFARDFYLRNYLSRNESKLAEDSLKMKKNVTAGV